MLILQEYFKTKMKKIGPLERMLHCIKIDKFKKMTLYYKSYKAKKKRLQNFFICATATNKFSIPKNRTGKTEHGIKRYTTG